MQRQVNQGLTHAFSRVHSRAVPLPHRFYVLLAGMWPLAAVLIACWLAVDTSKAVDRVIEPGDIFVSASDGRVLQYGPNGNLRRTLSIGRSGQLTGSAFDKTGNLYVTAGFAGGGVVKFDSALAFQGSFGSGYENNPESIVVDTADNFLVGAAAPHGSPKAVVKKLNSNGRLVRTYSLDTENRGTDWIDLAADQKTIFYTSEGSEVKRFDLETGEQLPVFSDAGGGPKFALRILSDGGVLVASSRRVVRLDKSGAVARTYRDGSDELFALNLDPDGKSFWTAEMARGELYKISIASGETEQTIQTGVPIGGLSVVGELTASTASTVPPPPPPQPPLPEGKVSFGRPLPAVFGSLASHSEGHSVLDFSSSSVTGSPELSVRTNFRVPGVSLELETDSGWKTIGNQPVHLHPVEGAPLQWPVRMRVAACPGTIDLREKPVIEVTGLGTSGRTQLLPVPIEADIRPDSWLRCWWPVLAGIVAVLFLGFVFYGFWSPSRFGERLGVMLSQEENIEAEGFFHPFRSVRGSGSGFYRDAAVYLSHDYRIVSKAQGALARIRADRDRVQLEPLSQVWRRTADGEWDQLPQKETPMRFGILYRNDSKNVFFELRSR